MRAAWPTVMTDRLRIARELVQGLSHLHRVGIVHGDLKLENV
jgi:serine/threonine protein kinase